MRMTSAADDASALRPPSVATMAEEFGPAVKWLGRLGGAVNFAQVAVGAQQDGLRGAAYAAIDAGTTNLMARFGWPGIASAVVYNAVGGSKGMQTAAEYQAEADALQGLTIACMFSK